MSTQITGDQIDDGTVGREDLNVSTSGSAVIRKLLATAGITIQSYTGVDAGTGDVTVAADLAFLDTKYFSRAESVGQNLVLAGPTAGAGAPTFRALTAGDIPAESDPVYTSSIPNQMMVKGDLVTGDDLDNFIETGIWFAPSNAIAETLLNAPVPSSGSLFSGYLEVVRRTAGGSTTQAKYQTYTENRQGQRVWYRGWLGTIWGPWKQMAAISDFPAETDPTVPAHVKSITSTNISNWNTAFGWGNHATAGYLTSYTESDPTVPSHVKSITTTNISNWNTAFGWGNHSGLYVLLSGSYANPSWITSLAWSKITGAPTIPTVNNATLTLATSGIATGSQTFTANQATNATFTVSVPGTNVGGAVSEWGRVTSSTGTNGYIYGLRSYGNGATNGDAINSTESGMILFANSSGSTNFPTTNAGTLIYVQTNINSALGAYKIWSAHTNDNELYYRTGASASTWNSWQRFASKEWVASQGYTTNTYTGSTSINLSGSSFQRAALTGDVTAAANSNATTIADNVVSNAKLRDSVATSVIGRSANSSGDPADIQALADNVVLHRRGGSLLFDAIYGNCIHDNSIPSAKIESTGAHTILANPTSLFGSFEPVSVGLGFKFIGSELLLETRVKVYTQIWGGAVTIAANSTTAITFSGVSGVASVTPGEILIVCPLAVIADKRVDIKARCTTAGVINIFIHNNESTAVTIPASQTWKFLSIFEN